MTPLDTDILADLIARKHGLLLQLRDLGRRQLELIEANDLTQLLKLIASKQKQLSALHALERQLDPFRQQDPETRLWRTAVDRDRCAEAASHCEALRAEIVQGERISETRLTFRRDEAAAQLQGVHQASQIRHAYSERRENEQPRLDLSSEG
jgi:hypothetical protein